MNNNRLYDLRESKDMYQKDIAEKIGIMRRTYSSWETGTKFIPLKHLNTLCNYYNVSMDYVLGLSSTKINKDINLINNLDKQEIGKRLKLIREKYKLTLTELAKELNTTPSTISAYENGKTMILTAFAYQICLKYNISLDWLCCRTKNSMN